MEALPVEDIQSAFEAHEKQQQHRVVAVVKEGEERGTNGRLTACVTGCTGYLAGHLVLQLLSRGHTVHGTMRRVEEARVRHLLQAEGAAQRLKLFAADLNVANSFDSAVQGCDAVFHVANVVALSAKDPVQEIILPSVNGLKAVLSAIEKAPSVKTFILTSSYAALEVGIPPAPRGPLTEADSNTAASPEWKPYSFSKVETERHAVEWIEQQKRSSGRVIKYASIHPPMIIGPQLNGDAIQSSSEVFDVMLNGTYPLLPPLWFPMVDVRDVAKAHIVACEHPNASGRYLVCAGHNWLMDLANWVREAYPSYPVPKYSMPVWAFKFVGLFDKRLDKGLLKENTQEGLHVDASKIVKDLGFIYDYDVKTATLDHCASLVEHQLCGPGRKATKK